MTKFICIGGKAQNGKDTTARMVKEELEAKGYKAHITHYADLLKFICRQYFNWDGKKDEYGRSLLQRVGTYAVRRKDPSYWVDFVLSIVSFFPTEWDYVIIPDTRFPNEIETIKENGYTAHYVRVNRMDFNSPLSEEQQKHPSETALDDATPDYLLENRTLEQLKEDVSAMCSSIIHKDVEQLRLRKLDSFEQLSFSDVYGEE